MGQWTREELQQAHDNFVATAAESGRTCDWGPWADLFTEDATYVEICEIPDHPWFLGCQFHPEFKSKPLEPHPLFQSFVSASHENRKRRASGNANHNHAEASQVAAASS